MSKYTEEDRELYYRENKSNKISGEIILQQVYITVGFQR